MCGLSPVEPRTVKITYFRIGDLANPYYSHQFTNQSIGRKSRYSFGENQGNNHSLVYFLEN